MAQITSTAEQRTFVIGRWLGVNENPDGDTKLKLGEAAEMRNWKITRDGHLQIRPGYGECASLGTTPVLGLWSGFIGGVKRLIASCGGKLFSIDTTAKTKTELGAVVGERAHFFGFSEKLYLLTGSKYYVYDGTTLSEVSGYRPLVSVSNPPAGGGAALEQVNKLCGARRAWFSPDGTATTFQLPEKVLSSVDYVKKTSDGSALSFTADLVTGIVTLTPALPVGTNSVEIGWSVTGSLRSLVEQMRFSETFNGAADTRIFLYGDGTNRAIYSGIDHDGRPNSEYFPDLNVMSVDSANTPITSMIRHYDSLLTFKSDGAFVTQYGAMTLPDGKTTAAFYTVAANREIGNAAPGQARLVKNNPLTLFGRSVYEWQLGSFGAKDERNAKSKSDRASNTLSGMSLPDAICFDDEYNSEYWVCQNGRALIFNYTADAWYGYTNIPASCFVSVDGKLFFGTTNGKLMQFSRQFRNDAGADIHAYWVSGAMDFSRDFRLKYASDLWLTMKPESGARLTVSAQSNRSSDYADKIVASSLSSFSHVDFKHFSFRTNRQPQVERIRLKVKKFAFYRLILESVSKSSTATVLGMDIKVRYAGNVK